MVKRTAAKRTDRGRAITNTKTTDSSPRLSWSVCPESDKWTWLRAAKEVPMEVTEIIAAATEAENTSRNLPTTGSRRGKNLATRAANGTPSVSAAVWHGGWVTGSSFREVE